MFNRILVPLDGSRFSRTALPLAAAVARGSAATLELFSANDPVLPPTVPGGELTGTESLGVEDPGLMADLRESMRTGRESELRSIAERLRSAAGVEPTVTLVDGSPSEAILRQVESRGIDLVVMSSHGRGTMERAWLGSVTDRVIRQLEVPILVVRPIESEDPEEEDVDLGATPVIDRVRIALDGSRLAEAALAPATRLAATLQVPVSLVRVIGAHIAPASPYIPHAAAEVRERTEAEREEAAGYLATIGRRLSEGGVRVAGQEVHDGPVARTLLETGDDQGRDVLAMATHGRGGIRRLVLGSVSDKVLRAAIGPVLLVRPSDADD